MKSILNEKKGFCANIFSYLLLVFLLPVGLPGIAKSQSVLRKIRAIKTEQPIDVDGLLNEPIWKKAPAVTQFKEKDPDQGAQPTEKTVVKVLYDDNAIYIGARMYDNAPDSIVAQLGRRDADLTADNFVVYLDPYDDKRTGFYFGINAAGSIEDGTLFNDSWDDDSWDGVWQGKTHIDQKGWTAEIRIPFSQLRFQKEKNYVWGINFKRFVARKNEKDFLVYQPRNKNGFVSRFPELTGIKNIKPHHHFEIVPYITTKASYLHMAPGNPFRSDSHFLPNTGADIRTSIGSNLILNATVNPDFGQVEVDPAVVNLSDVETYYPEKRPFFIEGSNFFDFGEGGATDNWNFNWWSPTFFYSRRIGRSPQGSAPDNVDYVKYPDGTHIIGAAKLTGRMKDNWNVGVLQALTSRENAKYSIGNSIYSAEVEPPSYYGVVRLQKQFNQSRQSIGILTTLTARNLPAGSLQNQLNKSAGVFGVDGWSFLGKKKTWVINGWMGMSHLTGTPQQMINLESSPTHYFQRPDFRGFHIDSTATSLTGFGGRIRLNKERGHVLVNAAFGFMGPRFDLNDVGFMGKNNVINAHFGAGYYWSEPTSWYRDFLQLAAVYSNFDYNGNNTTLGFFYKGRVHFLNYYRVSWHFSVKPKTINDRLTRGGPLALSLPGGQWNLDFSSDSRKKIILDGGAYEDIQPGEYHEWDFYTDIEYKPLANITFSVGPEYDVNHNNSQWVDVFNDPTAIMTYGKRYVFASLDQKTVSASIRLNWTFTPALSLQMYMQPLISSGKYTRFKALQRPRSYDFMVFGKDGNSTFDQQTYTADPDGNGPAPAMAIDNPDFNYKSLRGNAVLRWEYRRGSTLYLVWTQSRSETADYGYFDFGHSLNRLLTAKPNNIFLVKFSYWLNL